MAKKLWRPSLKILYSSSGRETREAFFASVQYVVSSSPLFGKVKGCEIMYNRVASRDMGVL